MGPVWFFCRPLEVVRGGRSSFPGPASPALSRGCNIFPWSSFPWGKTLVLLHVRSPEVVVARSGMGWISMAWVQQWRINQFLLIYSLHFFQNTTISKANPKCKKPWRGYDSINYFIVFLSFFHCIPSQFFLQTAMGLVNFRLFGKKEI